MCIRDRDSGPHAVRGAPDRRQEQRADVEPGNTLEELLFASDLFVGQFSHNSLSLSYLSLIHIYAERDREVLEGITSAYDGMRRRRNAFPHALGGSFGNNRG